MSKRVSSLSVALVAASIAVVSNGVSAKPFVQPLAIKNAAGAEIEMVRGRGFGRGFGAGFLGGAIIGGALAAPYYGYGYGYGYPYYGPYSSYGYPYPYGGYRGRYPFDRQLCCRF